MRYKWGTACVLVISILFSLTVGQDSLSGGVLELRIPNEPGSSSSKEHIITSESNRYITAPQLSYAWFEQRLDHSNESDSRQWLQRYFEYGGYYKPGGPIFLQLDAEGGGLPAPIDMVKKGSMVQYAKDQGAYIVHLEHRFYGLSRPMPDLSQRSFQYLNVDQVLDDIANFIAWFKVNSGFGNNKIVLFGSSYGGTLAKWFMQTYPNMTDVIVTSSAPLEARFEMPDYLDKLTEIINRTSPQCLQDLTEGFDCLEKAVQGKPCGEFHQYPPNIVDLFNLCEDISPENELDVTGLFYTIFNVFNNVIVNNIPDPKLSVSLEGICQSLSVPNNASSFEVISPLERLAKVVREVTQASDLACMEFSLDKIVRYLRETTWTAPAGINGDRQFEWQRCNELGWVRGSKEPKMPFGKRISSTFHMEICKRTFGLTENMMKRAIDDVNKNFKGKSVETQCGIFIHGQNDPWSVLGANSDEDVGPCNRVVLIEGAGHAKDTGVIAKFDSNVPSIPPALKPAQREIGKILGTWLKQGNCCESKIIVEKITSYKRVTPVGSEAVAIPSDPALQSNQQQSVSPLNDIGLSESNKVERKLPKATLDNIEIQNGVPFKEITKFLKKHEDQFFTPDADHNRYRVRIRKTNSAQTGEQTFSKFGIKIRMLQPAPAINQLNKTADWDSLPQWTRWTDFETKETINPNGTVVRPGGQVNSKRPKGKEGSLVEESHDSHELFRSIRHQHRDQKDDKTPTDGVHSLHNRFGLKINDAANEDKSLLVIKLHGQPELIPLTDSQNSQKNSTRVIKRVRVKHVHRSSKNNKSETSAVKPLVEPTKLHEKKVLNDSEQYITSPEKTLADFGVGSHEDTLFLSNRKHLQSSKTPSTSEPLELWPPIREDPDGIVDSSAIKNYESRAKQSHGKITPLTRFSPPERTNGTRTRKLHHNKTSSKNSATSTTSTTIAPVKDTPAPLTTWGRRNLTEKHQPVRHLPHSKRKQSHDRSSKNNAALPSSQAHNSKLTKDKPLADQDDEEDANPDRPEQSDTESSTRNSRRDYEEGQDQADVSHPNKDHREIGAPDVFEQEIPSEFERALAGEGGNRTAKSRHRGTSHRHQGSKVSSSLQSNQTHSGAQNIRLTKTHSATQNAPANKESGNQSHKESHGNHVHQGTANNPRSHHGNHTIHGGKRFRHLQRNRTNLTSQSGKLTTHPEVSKVYVVKVRRKHSKNKNGTRQGGNKAVKLIHRELLLTRNNSTNNNETLIISSTDYRSPLNSNQPTHNDPTDPIKKPWIVQLTPQGNKQKPNDQKSVGLQQEYKKPAMQMLMLRDSNGKKFPIPQAALDWRNPKSPFVDMSVGSKKGSLALTPEDVAWVNYGIQ